MDRRSNKKISLFFIGWIGLVVFLTFTFLVLQQSGEKNRNAQVEELTSFYPEQNEIFVETSDYYKKQMEYNYWIGWGSLVILTGAGTILLYRISRKQESRRQEKQKRNMELLADQLKAFQKGNYQMIDQEERDDSEWENIWDAMHHLAYFFSELKENLDQEENSTKTLISDISHQLKTPLASLRMSHELSMKSELSVQEKLDFWQQEDVEIKRLEVLLQELIHLSRLENHMIQIHLEKQGIRKTITEAVNLVFFKAHEKNIELQVQIPEDVLVCHDTKWTVEALANVLDNAVKYSEPKTMICVTVSKLPNVVLIDIEDEGIGIPAQELHQIYQRFYRGQGASCFNKEGAGIGLYLTRRILEEQGGTIAAKRKQAPLQGTIFRITLPL